MRNDLHSTLHYKVALAPQTQTNDDTAIVGEILDLQGFEGCEFVIATGTLTDADATFAVLVEEDTASDLSTKNAVADADLLGTEALAAFDQADDKAIRKIGYVGNKRYVRITITPTGNSSGAAPLGVVAVLYKSNRKGVITDGGQDG